MATKPFLPVDSADFFKIKENLKKYLKTQTAFQDYDFEGSNINVLLDLLAYNTYYNAHYLNMVGSEMFLDSSQLKESIVSHSKELNYIPRSRKAAEAVVRLEANPPVNVSQIFVPGDQKITSSISNVNLNFYPLEPITILPDGSGNYVSEEFSIFQGEYVEEFFDVELRNGEYISEFNLRSENIDTSTIIVDVFESPESVGGVNFVRYKEAKSLFNLNGDSEVFFVQGYRENRYQIYFGNGITGKRLSTGNVIRVSYLSTLGENGNNVSNFRNFTYNGITFNVTTIEPSKYGLERESIESIKMNAPKHFETQERAVTTSDFETLVLQNFPFVQAVKAYGGEKAEPKRYGKVLLACKPYGTEALISNSYKQQIQEFLKLRNITTEPIVVNPEFFYVEMDVKVYYNKKLLKNKLRDLEFKIADTILGLNNDTFNDFGKDLYYSKVLKKINETDEAILTSDLILRIIKLWKPRKNEISKFKFSYENPIFNYSLLSNSNQFLEFPSSFSSSMFEYVKENGERTSAYLRDNSNGSIYIYEILPNGNENIIKQDVGTIDYETGDVEIVAQIADFSNEIRLYAKTLEKNIFVKNNKFLIVRSQDVDYELINRETLED